MHLSSRRIPDQRQARASRIRLAMTLWRRLDASDTARRGAAERLRSLRRPGSRATVTFTGTAELNWMAAAGPGRFGSSLPRRHLPCRVQICSPGDVEARVRCDGPCGGSHTVAIKATGSRSPAATSNFIFVDALDVRSRVEERDPLPLSIRAPGCRTTRTTRERHLCQRRRRDRGAAPRPRARAGSSPSPARTVAGSGSGTIRRNRPTCRWMEWSLNG